MQVSFFDESGRLEELTKLGDTLVLLKEIAHWDIFVPILDRAILRKRMTKGGRPACDNLLMFKILIIKRLYNLSHDQTEYQIQRPAIVRAVFGFWDGG